MRVMDELRTCPFCGGEARLYTTASRRSYRRAVVKCKQCGCELRAEGGGYHDFGEGKTYEEKRSLSNETAKSRAISAWNHRVTPTEAD